MLITSGRYLVLGATGLVGSHVLCKLKDNAIVQVRAHFHRREPKIFAKNINYVQGDLKVKECHAEFTRDIDYVLMCAGVLSTAQMIAKDPITPVMDNLLMTAHALEAAWRAGVKKFIWLSSVTGYPESSGEIAEDEMFVGDPPDVHYPVGWMTRYLETMGRMYAEKLKLPMTAVALRPTMIYGPYDNFDFSTCHFLPALIRRVVERQNPIEIWSDGAEARDLVFGADVADACLLATRLVSGWATFNLSFGRTYTINELAKKLIEIDGFKDARIAHLPKGLATSANRTFSNKKLRNYLGYRPSTSIEEGLKATIRWYRENRELVAPEGG